MNDLALALVLITCVVCATVMVIHGYPGFALLLLGTAWLIWVFSADGEARSGCGRPDIRTGETPLVGEQEQDQWRRM
jgi:hypothetical protein